MAKRIHQFIELPTKDTAIEFAIENPKLNKISQIWGASTVLLLQCHSLEKEALITSTGKCFLPLQGVFDRQYRHYNLLTQCHLLPNIYKFAIFRTGLPNVNFISE